MKVLLTGASGFVASHCLEVLLEHGHDIVATVRSEEKGAMILRQHIGVPREKLSYVVVPDIGIEGAFDAAVQTYPPLDAVVHTASPFHFNVVNAQRDLIEPAVIGTGNILSAVHKLAPTVRRVVLTSSFAAMINPAHHPAIYDESIWNPVTPAEADQDAVTTYRASKTFAERAAWDFVEHERPQFSLATINPPSVHGPVHNWAGSPKSLNTSSQRFWDMIHGKMKDRLAPTGTFLWVDVRDVALAHVKAIELDAAAGKRFFCVAGQAANADIAGIIITEFPQLRSCFPAQLESDIPHDTYGFSNEQTVQTLGIRYRSLRQSLVDTVNSLQAPLQ